MIETDRLMLRPLVPADAEDFYKVFSDPQVLRYTPSGPPESVEQAREWLEARATRGDHVPGVRTCAVVLLESSRVIGTAGIVPVEGHEHEHEVAYHLASEQWGKGLATEAANAWIEFGFETMGLERIIGLTYPENVASRRVLIKVGMTEHGETEKYFGVTTVMHDIALEEWVELVPGCRRVR